MVEWRFPSNGDGEIKGLNDSGIAQFRGTPLRSLAREICQNSLDAAVDETVKVQFNAYELDRDKLPGVNELSDVFNRCANSDHWKGQKSVTTRRFFENAGKIISAPKVSVLRISDFCTTGLTGAHEVFGSNWTNLTKSSGVSDKKAVAGGSFGIGKFAPFACTDFSTVFYSTYDVNGVEAAQGVARLVTFERSDGEDTQGVGYYGEEKNRPFFEQFSLDPSFVRREGEYGTDIYIPGYRYMNSGEWEESIIISILDSFLGAIWEEKLVVEVGTQLISKSTLGELIEQYHDILQGHTAQYYEVLTSPKTVWKEEDFKGLGNVRLGLLLGNEDMPRRVAMIRQTGMKIKDQDRISSFIPFAGVMFIDGERINARLRELENPEHTKWEIDRAENTAQARFLLTAIHDYIKKSVTELSAQNTKDDMDVAGLGALLPDDADDETGKNKKEDITDTLQEVKKTTPHKKTIGNPDGEDDGEGLRDGGYTAGKSTLGYIHGKNKRKKQSKQQPFPVDVDPDGSDKIPNILKRVAAKKVRIMCQNKEKGLYFAIFVPDTDGQNGTLEISLSAESGNYPAHILKAMTISPKKELEIEGNKVKGLLFEENQPIKLSLQIDFNDYCSMEVRAYADKK